MAEAIEMILDLSHPLDILKLSVQSSLAGHVLSEDVTAPQQIPISPSTNVDGYAVQGAAVIHNLL